MKRLRVSPETFVGHLLNEKNTLHFELSATPMDFRPREGWLAEASGIPHHLFYFCKNGSIKAKVGSVVLDLKAGDAIWIGPEVPFRLQSDEPMVTSLSRFRLRLDNSGSVNFALKNDFVVARSRHSMRRLKNSAEEKPRPLSGKRIADAQFTNSEDALL